MGKYPASETHNPKLYYVGIFDYEALVKGIAAWFNAEGYEYREKVYKSKVPSPDGSEHEFAVDGWRKTNELVWYFIEIKCHIWDMKEVEVLVDGEKKRMIRGRVQMWFHNWFEVDYNRKYKSPVEKQLLAFLEKYIWKKKIDGGFWDENYFSMLRVYTRVKQILKMSTPTNAAALRGL